MSTGLQLLGTTLGVLGWLGIIISCALPLWRVTAFIGTNIVTAQIMWEGLWMSCVVQSTGQMQCNVYDSMLALPQDLQASRAILIIASLVGLIAILASFVGGKCTNCLPDDFAKAWVAVAGGAAFVTAGVLGLVPSSWTAHRVIGDFYNPLVAHAQKRELGAAIYICWGAAVLMLVGGGLLCSSCPKGRASRGGLYMAASRNRRERLDYV
ncbi:claudin-like protein ZF-A9 isoform X2 [Sinocyclocheilus anshuiensis]|uniref:Claudin n=2 Tax=Sinocyclocheilus anshuiensis TaxID=1608454 RepID=A0A671KMB5_9TELE|nr:PREDICTED: claudin-like protein ZF-A9 isoform X2 [Sinocyclocheilus anshuiensis]